MQLKIHNQLSHVEVDYDKIKATVHYHCESQLEKHGDSKRWRIDVWCKDGDGLNQNNVSCGLSLKRPGLAEIYIKKDADNIHIAIAESVRAMEKTLRREGTRWTHIDHSQLSAS